MNNNNEHIDKLEREIWLFEQWLNSIQGQAGETPARIRNAYRECISSRRLELARLISEQEALQVTSLQQAGLNTPQASAEQLERSHRYANPYYTKPYQSERCATTAEAAFSLSQNDNNRYGT